MHVKPVHVILAVNAPKDDAQRLGELPDAGRRGERGAGP
jgi:hypothetical protein